MNDNYRFRFIIGDETKNRSDREMVSGRNHHFLCDPRRWAGLFPNKLTARLVDLLRIATAVYVTDRTSARDRLHADSGWSRSLTVRIDVFDCDFWSSAEVLESLRRCLEFLSGDLWDISFSPTLSAFDLRQFAFKSWKPLEGDPVICLYSGGLDSAAGLVRSLRQHGSDNIVPLLVMHQNGQRKLVRKQIACINGELGAKLEPLIMPFWMRSPSELGAEENSQRTRSFLFCAVAAVAATVVEARVIQMMEGGIGAINLPLMTGMVGSKATRGSHPTFLQRLSDLLKLVADRELSVELPHLLVTKGELARSLVDAGLGSLAFDTVSCVHYPLRDSDAKQCGFCPACIFRRQALVAAGIDDSRAAYQYDILGASSSSIPDEKLVYLKAFLMQIEKLSPLDTSAELPAFVVRHLRATEVIAGNSIPAEFADLYRRYRREWVRIVEGGRQAGWHWTQMVAPAFTAC